jgi:probable rRNA maturation factor
MIVNRQRGVRVSPAALEKFLGELERLFRLPPRAVTVCLVSDAAIARLNRSFRARRGPTDVLSFPGDGRPARFRGAGFQPALPGRLSGPRAVGGSEFYLGDIAIAPAVARRNARRAGRAVSDELHRLVLHGVLHLMGYDHETDRGEMHRRERALRRRLGLS